MTPISHPTDHELKTAITDELSWTPSVDADRIGVALNRGAVTLSGQVQTYPERREAIRAAMRVRGVTAVADEMLVKNDWAPREDADIAIEATDSLNRMVSVPTGSVQVKVRNHVVTLTGSVAWEYQRDATGYSMAALRGVHEVVNMISLRPTATVSATDAQAKITAALVRNAQTDAGTIRVTVTGTEVRLTGTVTSWAEFRQADYAAWCSPGVTHVDNRLVVTA
jgi:osmotically-inducible protein OsmY